MLAESLCLVVAGGDEFPARVCQEGRAMTVEERLQKIEVMLAVLVERQQVREWYSV